MISLELTTNEASLLLDELKKGQQHTESERLHTERRSMRAALGEDLEALESLRARLQSAIDREAPIRSGGAGVLGIH